VDRPPNTEVVPPPPKPSQNTTTPASRTNEPRHPPHHAHTPAISAAQNNATEVIQPSTQPAGSRRSDAPLRTDSRASYLPISRTSLMSQPEQNVRP
jgi:hypothetical protein